MPRSLLLSAAIALTLAACSSSTPAPPETPEASAKPDAPAPPGDSSAKPDEPAPPPPGEVKRDPRGDSVPDDYQLTERDCSELGKQYADVAKSDQMKGVSSKLSEKQRNQAEASIDKAVSQVSSQWTDTCFKSLVGKSVDAKGIKCALASKTVKDFDICLNGEQTPQPREPQKPKKK